MRLPWVRAGEGADLLNDVLPTLLSDDRARSEARAQLGSTPRRVAVGHHLADAAIAWVVLCFVVLELVGLVMQAGEQVAPVARIRAAR